MSCSSPALASDLTVEEELLYAYECGAVSCTKVQNKPGVCGICGKVMVNHKTGTPHKILVVSHPQFHGGKIAFMDLFNWHTKRDQGKVLMICSSCRHHREMKIPQPIDPEVEVLPDFLINIAARLSAEGILQ